MSQTMLARLNEISTIKKIFDCAVFGEEHAVYRLYFDKDPSNFFIFRAKVKGAVEKIIDLDTGNALFPHNKGSNYMVFHSDYKTIAPYLYRLFIIDDKTKLVYGKHTEFVDYSDGTHNMYDFVIDGNVLSFGYEKSNLDLLSIKLSQQDKKLIRSNAGSWRIEM